MKKEKKGKSPAKSEKKQKALEKAEKFRKGGRAEATSAEIVASASSLAKPERPTLESILDAADSAFTGVVKNYMRLGEALVDAVRFYGEKGRKAFRTRYPLTDNALRHLELVGSGKLLPQFTMCSDKFVNGLANMPNSLSWQYKLLGSSEDGKIRIRVGEKFRDVRFEDLRSGEVDGVLSIVAKSDESLTSEELGKKIRKMNRDVRGRFVKSDIPTYEIRTKDGETYLQVLRPHIFGKEEFEGIAARLQAAWRP